MHISTKHNHYCTVLGSGQKTFTKPLFEWSLLVNSEMWIHTAIKLPHNLGVCQKTEGNLAANFYAVEKNPDILNLDSNKITSSCKCWNAYMYHLLKQKQTFMSGNWAKYVSMEMRELSTSFWWKSCHRRSVSCKTNVIRHVQQDTYSHAVSLTHTHWQTTNDESLNICVQEQVCVKGSRG